MPDDAAASFPPESAIRRVTRTRAVLLFGPAALALQVSHPLVAAGVRDHSDFAEDPLRRLRHTLESSYAAVFAPPAEMRRAVGRVNRLHATVRGPGYAALDPDLLLWVMATLVMTGIAAHARFLAPLSEADRAGFYRDMRVSTARFGLPRNHGPQDWEAFCDYYAAQLADPATGTSDVSRGVARQITRPTRPWFLVPTGPLARLWLAETLPPVIGDRLGFGRSTASRLFAASVDAVARPLLRHGPSRLRLTQAARAAEAREQLF